LILKVIVKELQESLLPRPLFVEPIATIQTLCSLEDVLETNTKMKGSSSLLMAIKIYILEITLRERYP
jgi:hypothetical protein